MDKKGSEIKPLDEKIKTFFAYLLEKHIAKEVFFMGEMVTLIKNVGFPIAVACPKSTEKKNSIPY